MSIQFKHIINHETVNIIHYTLCYRSYNGELRSEKYERNDFHSTGFEPINCVHCKNIIKYCRTEKLSQKSMNLTTEQIIEYNIVLAQFEGKLIGQKILSRDYSEMTLRVSLNVKPKSNVFASEMYLSYHSDWNELMRVWGKILDDIFIYRIKSDNYKLINSRASLVELSIKSANINESFENLYILVTELNKIKQ